ncbi:MAG: glycoside hydrolase family 5 protein [Breznakibacter sp.]|nr:glycoside hydrolase family 5 protein [Breznakibacter sp.]
MKKLRLITLLVLGVVFIRCSSASYDEVEPTVLSGEAVLKQIVFSYKKSLFNAQVEGEQVIIQRKIPLDALLLDVASMQLSPGATSTVKVGQSIDCSGVLSTILVTAEDGKTTKTYTLKYNKLKFSSAVDYFGKLKVAGNKILGDNDLAVSLAGNSFFWSNNDWGGNRFYNESVVQWLKIDWGSTIVRAAMGVEDAGGYLQKKDDNLKRVETLVDAAIKLGLYVIIDWHSHYAHLYEQDAIDFFQKMAHKYGGYDNVIYEIYNEPKYVDATPANDGKFATWNEHIKPYAEKVIAAIRAIDPDNLIVVGTGEWSQKVDDASANPIDGFDNIAYALHFYSINHKQWLRDRASAALKAGLPLVVTEWGAVGDSQNDPETQSWMAWCKTNQLIHCSWAVNDKPEPWSIVKQDVGINGQWLDSQLTESGKLSRDIIRNW